MGFDEDCFSKAGVKRDSCLMWVQTRYDRLFLIGKGGYVFPKPLKGIVSRMSPSPRGGFFLESRSVGSGRHWRKLWYKLLHWRGGYRHTVRSWDGGILWGTASHWPYVIASVWDDGSAVLLGTRETGGVIWMKFFDKCGRPRGHYKVPPESSSGWRQVGVAKNHVAIALHGRGLGVEILLFDKMGRLVWRTDVEGDVASDSMGASSRSGVAGIAVSDCGEVCLVHVTYGAGSEELQESRFLVYDPEGRLVDCREISPTRYYRRWLRVIGPYVIVSHVRGFTGDSHAEGELLCYSLEKMAPQFTIQGRFGSCDVDIERSVLAVALVSCRRNSVVLYDLDGEYQAEIDANSRPAYVKFVDGDLLVAEANKLKLYEVK